MQGKNSTKVNLYYHIIFRRTNVFKEVILGFFYSICSTPRLILEVFLRKSMGERYFNYAIAIFIGLVLLVSPLAITAGFMGMSKMEIAGKYLSWYAFVVAFFVFSYQRYMEVKREPSVYNFGKFSMSSGIWLPFLNEIVLFGKRATPRKIAIIYEPAIFVIGGLFLFLIGQIIGLLLLVCGVIYSFSYMAAYKMGDDFVMDQIDKMICNENMYDSFVLQKRPEETKGFSFFGNGPDEADQRENLVNSFFADNEEPSAMAS